MKEIKINVDEKKNKYAFITLVMKGDSYGIGAIVLSKSFRKHHQQHHQMNCGIDMCCMITKDVSSEMELKLKQHFDFVFKIPYLQCRGNTYLSNTQKKMYGQWNEVSFTKWNVLQFVQYERVCFIDADAIFMKDCSNLFHSNLQTPAATWTSPRHTTYCLEPGQSKYNPHVNIKHGDRIPKEVIDQSLYSKKNMGMVCSAALVLLTPDTDDYKNFVKMLTDANGRGYGYLSCSGLDEQSIVDFYHRIKKVDWYHIHQTFQFIPWKINWLKNEPFDIEGKRVIIPSGGNGQSNNTLDDLLKNDQIYIIHYFNIKPWQQHQQEWDDLKYWKEYL